MTRQHRMIRRFLPPIILSLLSFLLALPLQAAYLRNVPQSLSQPDGTVVECFASGDEFANWLHDTNGFVIIRHPETGFLVYATSRNGEVVPTDNVVGTVDPKAVGLQPGVMISPELYQQRVTAARGLTPRAARARAVGVFNNLVIFIRFSNEAEFTDPASTFTDMHNSTAANANSVHNYFYETSYGALTVSTSFYPTPSGSTVVSYRDANPRDYYRPYNATTNTLGYRTSTESRTREHTLLKNAINAVAAQIPANLVVDGNGDGYVDNLCFIVSGSPDGWSDLLWPHQWQLYSYAVNINGKRVGDYTLQLRSLLLSQGVGVLCHELFHSIGAPDLYHYTGNGMTPVGSWDVMENNANPPQHMLTYMKYRYGGWIESIPEIMTSGTYTLHPATAATNNCYKIASPNSTTEYFIVEYRRKTGTFENSVPGSGLLVYRINTAVDGAGNRNGPPDEVYIYRPNGTTTSNGAIASAAFSQNSGRIAINDSANPASFLSNGSAGGLDISAIGSIGETISFHVTKSGGGYLPDLWASADGTGAYIGDNNWNAGDQLVQRTVPGGTPAVYNLAVQNDGGATDSFTVVGDPGAGDWAVRYFDAPSGGNEITGLVTTAGWPVAQLPTGDTRHFRMEVTPGASIPANGAFVADVTAVSQADPAKSDTVETLTTKAPLSVVTLTVDPPGSCLSNTPITLTATAVGGKTIEYRFYQIYEGVTTRLQGYGAANRCTVTPTAIGRYQFIVWAREAGNTNNWDCYATLVYLVNPSLSAVTLAATPRWPQAPGTPVTLQATPVNGGQVEYRFYVAVPGDVLRLYRQYSAESACVYTPTTQGIYQFVVYAREVGSTVAKQAYASITYNVATPTTGVTLTADAPTGVVNTPLTLTAQATGGLKVQYRYFVSPPGGVYTTIQHYAVGATSCQYTPTAPGTYYFLVWVRETGSAQGKDAYKVLVYTVR